VYRAFFASFGREYVWLGLLKLVVDALMFTGPVLLQHLVAFIEHSTAHEEPARNG
jgi:hypothetical protein